MIDKKYPTKALEVARLIPSTDHGISQLESVAKELIDKKYPKEAREVAKLIPYTSTGNMTRESISKKLAAKGEVEEALEIMPRKTKTTSSKKRVSKSVISKKEKAVSINRNLQITQIALAALAICSIAIAAGVGTFVLRYMFDHLRKQVFQVASQSFYTH